MFQPIMVFILTDKHTVLLFTGGNHFKLAPCSFDTLPGGCLSLPAFPCDKELQTLSPMFSAPAQRMLVLFNEKSCLETKIVAQRRPMAMLATM